MKKTQIKFLEWMAAEGLDPTSTVFTRSFLRSIAMKNGMAWAPAWIVKDKSRIDSRGSYRVPEYSEYIKQRGLANQAARMERISVITTTEPAIETVSV